MAAESIDPLLTWCTKISSILCFSAIFIAGFILLGWLIGDTTLTGIHPSFQQTQIITALYFILMSISVLMLQNNKIKHVKRMVCKFSSIVVLLGAILSIYLQVENINLPFFIMPLLTSINFTLMPVALIFIDNELVNKNKIFLIFIILILLNSLFSLLGYVFNVDTNYSIVSSTRMGVYTSLEFFILCMASILTRPNRGVVPLLFEKTTSAVFLRRVPLILLIVVVLLSLCANIGQHYGLYDDAFGDLLTAIGSIIILFGVLIVTSLQIRKEASRGDSNEALFLGFSENTDEVFWQTTQNMDKVLYVSPAFEKIWGQSREILRKNPLSWLDTVDQNERVKVENKIKRFSKDGSDSIILEYKITLPDGIQRYIYDRRFPQYDKQGQVISILGISTDISHLKQANFRLIAMNEIAKAIESGENSKAISDKILEILCMHLDWDIGEILLVNDSKKILECFSIWSKSNIKSMFLEQLGQITFNLESGAPGKAWKDVKTLWRIDPLQPFNIITSNEGDPVLRTIIAIPIIFKNRVIGILELLSTKIKPLENTLLQWLENIGIQLGEYISHQYTEERITQLSDQDVLTGLMAQHVFERKLQNKINSDDLKYFPVIVLDLDKIKLINEALGYEAVDKLINMVVEKLEKHCDTKWISRFRNNKFAMLPENLENINQVTNYVYKILTDIKQPININDKPIVTTVSIGVSLFPTDGNDSKQLLKNADLAVQKAKQEGGDNFQFYTKELANVTATKLELVSEIRNAIIKNELLLYLQPKINLKTGKIQAAETLIRWQHPTKGLLTPNVFMPIAEENNLVIPITEWIIAEACKIINNYKLKVPVAINLSGDHFKENFNLIGYLNQILKSFHINASSIELEITESVFMKNSEQNISVLIDLKKMGFKIAIDDFGTGFSSLNYLRHIAADYIKIDKSFIDHVPDNVDSVIIVKALIELSHALNKKVIAEGVESLRQLQFLVDEDCDQIQGYYFSKPLSIEEFMVLINEDKTWDIPK